MSSATHHPASHVPTAAAPSSAPPVATTAPHAAADTVESDDDDTVSQATVPAIPVPSAKRGTSRTRTARKRLPVPDLLHGVDPMRWQEHHCYFRPWGTCWREPVRGSAFCRLHSCHAINADGDRCNNLVLAPQKSRFCTVGWHAETSRDGPLIELVEARRDNDRLLLEASDDSDSSARSDAVLTPRHPATPASQKRELVYDLDRWYVAGWTGNLRKAKETSTL